MALNGGVIFKLVAVAVVSVFINFQLVTMMEISLTHGEPMIKNDNHYLNLDSLRVRKVNRTHHLLIGNLTLHVNQGNDYELYGVLFKKQGNDYKKTPYKMGPKKFCDFIRDDKMFFPSVRADSDFPSEGTCPWTKNIYHIFGSSIQVPMLPPTFATGDYMVETSTILNGKFQNGFRIYGTITNLLSL